MNEYVTTLPFDEVGLSKDGFEVGLFSGEAHLDEGGNVVGLTLDVYKRVGSRSLQRTIYLDTPPCAPLRKHPLTVWEQIADEIGTWIEKNCDVEIQERLDDWRASSDEPEYEPTTIADEFEGIRSDLRAIMEAK